MRPIRTNWCDSCGNGHNFGDQLTPVLLEHFGIPVVWSAPARAELVAVGSILSKIPDGWKGTVLGTGFIRKGMRRDLSSARVLSVRGALTRDACRLSRDTPLGDLGLLVPDLVEPVEPDIDVLLAPHTVDNALVKRYPNAEVIDLHHPPVEVVATIARSRLVITSSLHALIAADALGVRWQLEPFGAVVGGLYKFVDYLSSVGTRLAVGRPCLSARSAVVERQDELHGLLDGYARMRSIE